MAPRRLPPWTETQATLARGVEAGDVRGAVDVGLDAAHRVVVARLDVDGLLGDVDAGEVAADQDDLAKRLVDALLRHDGDVERDGAVGEAAALVDLGLLGAADDVARGELHLVRRVALHEALALGVQEVGALAARALGDQEALARERGRVVLDHLHVHERRTDPVGHRDPVAGADERVRGRAPDLAVAAGREDHVLRLEELHRAGLDVPRDGADALAVAIDRERGREVLLVAVDRVRVLHELLVEDVHDRLAGDVGDVVGAGGRGAAEGAGAEVALVVAVEGDAEVLEVDDLLGRLAAHDLDRVLVAQVVGALDRVERVRLPRVVGIERRVDPALRGVRVRAHGVDLRDDPDGDASLGGSQRGALTGQPCSYDKYVVTRHPRRVTLFGRNPTAALRIQANGAPFAALRSLWRHQCCTRRSGDLARLSSRSHCVRSYFGLLFVCLSAVAVGCGAEPDRTESEPSPEAERLVAIGLHDLAEAPGNTPLITSIDVSAGGKEHERRGLEYGCGDAPFQVVRVESRLVYCNSDKAMSIEPDLTGEPEVIGRGEYFLPAGDGTIWLIGAPHHLPGHLRDGGDTTRVVRQVDLEGQVLASGKVETECFPVAAVVAGPLCQLRKDGLGLIDIESGGIAENFRGTFPATSANMIAACDEPCPTLFISDVEAGTTKEVKAPEPLEFAPGYDGQFTLDGSRLATTVFIGPPQRDKRFPHQNRKTGIAIVDVETDKVTLVPESDPDGSYGRIAWSEDGERVYFASRRPGNRGQPYYPWGQLSVYDVNSLETELVPFDLKDTIFQLAAF